MEITLDLLMKGLAFTCKGNTFLPTAEYVTPFVDEMKKLKARFIVKVETVQNTPYFNDERMWMFEKVWIQAIVGLEIHHMIYALDTRFPTYKFFKSIGHNVDEDSLIVGKIQPMEKIPNDFTKLLKIKSDISKFMKDLSETKIVDKTGFLGILIDRCMTYKLANEGLASKLSPNEVLTAYREELLEATKEKYLIDIYRCMVENIWKDKDIFTIPEKIIITKHLFSE